jgi:hypothetical protein
MLLRMAWFEHYRRLVLTRLVLLLLTAHNWSLNLLRWASRSVLILPARSCLVLVGVAKSERL